MRSKILQLLFVCLLGVFAAQAQTVKESDSSLILTEKSADAVIVVENPANSFNGKISLELLDENNFVRGRGSQNARIRTGDSIHKISFRIGDLLKTAQENIAWFRLSYKIADEKGTERSQGIISLSELLKDIFELRVAAAENVFSGQTYRVKVRAIQPYTKLPVKNVKIEGLLELEIDTEADEDEITLKVNAETDSDGFATLDFKIAPELKLDYDAHLKISASKNGIVLDLHEDPEVPEKSGTAFLTTDKPIYQPGQEFNIRALYFDNNNNVVTKTELEFTIKSEDELVLYKEKIETSDFGVAAMTWKIPENAKLGNYRVEVENEDSQNVGTESFKVTRYDLPNFAVTAKPDKTFYLPDDKQAEVTVNADYLFGKPVLKGKVRVVQESERRWNYREQKYDVEEKQTFEGEVDAEGKFVAKISLAAAFSTFSSNSWQRFEDLNFAAYFTDSSTNRTEQRRFDIRLSKKPIHIYLIGNRYDLNPTLPFTTYISTFYADGTPAVCDVAIMSGGEKIAAIKTNLFGAGKAEFQIPNRSDKSWRFYMSVTAKDKDGQTGILDEDFYFDNDDALKITTEKTILKPGENVKIKLLSSKQNALVYLDIVKDWSVIDSRFVKLSGGKGEITVPYSPSFKGELTVSAYFESEKEREYYYSDNLVKNSLGIIYPEKQNLKLDAEFSNAVYKPNEEAKVKFSVFDGIGNAVETALGIVVFDKAVEERARTDAEFGSYFSRYYKLLGYSKSFGGVSLKDLNELELSKPISDEMQLAAEVMLSNNYYYPNVYRSRFDRSEANALYSNFFKKQIAPIEKILQKQFEKEYAHPTDDSTLNAILEANGVNFEEIRDPWGQNYRAVFEIDKAKDIVRLQTAGADKQFGTKDDFTVSGSGFEYFKPTGKAIDEAVKNHFQNTGGFIRHIETLKTELLRQNIDLENLKDRWNRDYRIDFEVVGRKYVIRISSNGANGLYQPNTYNSDDFTVWRNEIDYFGSIETKINQVLSKTVNAGNRKFPKTTDEFVELLKEHDLDFRKILDGYGEPVYLDYARLYRYADKTIVINGKQEITPVTEELAVFTIVSNGANRIKRELERMDDFNLASFFSVLGVQSKDTKFEKTDVRNISYSGANGAIRGTVKDPQGATVPGATVTATTEFEPKQNFTRATNEKGVFLIENIPSGKYSVRIDASGFKSSVFSAIQVRSQNLIEMNVILDIGGLSEVVNVTDASNTIDTSDTKIDTNISGQRIAELPINARNALNLLKLQPGISGKGEDENSPMQETSTPRLREYFPETLVWKPELITDKNGKAEMKFKLADNITTWKLYTVASTKNGKIGIVEKEIQAFQSFFVDLDPPKFLTEGDEIYLPTQVRNYTESKQKVNVSMAKADWFSFLDQDKQQIEVASGASENAVFGFKANAAINGGKQRVTAIASKESDAIEKPVTVRPDGKEIVKTDSKLFSETGTFDINFPANALPNTQKAELKIYPNLFSHVSESVEGLLQRPYGCGEQTISSTYPNLMILKFKSNEKSESEKLTTALEVKARRNLLKGYERLIGYQVANGGISYWGGKDEADVALTAYAIRFLSDASNFIEVDQNVIKRATDWLIAQQKVNGSFTKKYYYETSEDSNRTKLFTSYVARTLAMNLSGQKDADANSAELIALQIALNYLKTRNNEIDEPYALALFGLASLDAGNLKDAGEVAERLAKISNPEGDAVYWKLETNTPFYGWGTAGRIETTALVVQFLTKADEKIAEQKDKNASLISKGILFMLKNKDRYGVWYSTQTTINVLDAFLASLANQTAEGGKNEKIQVALNGETLQEIQVSAEQIAPITLNLSGQMNLTTNRLVVNNTSSSPVMAQVVANHYIDWNFAEAAQDAQNISGARQLRLDYKCDKTSAAIMQEISCKVETERVGFRGYGMLLAEIGTPPGADVSRESLEEALRNDWSLSRYDILPDRIIFYMWSKPGGTNINFKFEPRYGISAQTPASIVYDYYNPEAQAIVAPLRFLVK